MKGKEYILDARIKSMQIDLSMLFHLIEALASNNTKRAKDIADLFHKRKKMAQQKRESRKRLKNK